MLGFLHSVDLEHPLMRQRAFWRSISAENPLESMLEFDWKFTLADNDLRKVRVGTALMGLDVGFPLLSDEIVRFSRRLDPKWKLRRGRLRWFFKEALRDLLPEAIINKKKHGFGLPFGSWACQQPDLKAIVVSSLSNLSSRGVLKSDYASTLVEERLPSYPAYYGELVWVLTILELWLQEKSPNWAVR